MTVTILVVDDSKVIRDLAKFSLRRLGHTLLEAEDGEEAWDLLQSHSVDLIITDLNMPRLGGMELTQRVKGSEKLKAVPVFMLTTESTSEVAMIGKSNGVCAWLVKPFNPEKLCDAVTKVLSA